MEDQAKLLHVLGYLALRFGRIDQAIALLRDAAARAPKDRVVIRTLTLALIHGGAGDEAVAAVDTLSGTDAGGPDAAMLSLLRGRALLAAGRLGEARECFLVYLASQETRPPC